MGFFVCSLALQGNAFKDSVNDLTVDLVIVLFIQLF